MSRLVVLLFGPSGAGKTTIARAFTLTIYDRDDPQWRSHSEAGFRRAIGQLAHDPLAQAVGIRAGATSSARQTSIRLVRATHAFLVMPTREICHYQAGHRRRGDVRASHASIESWFDKFDHDDNVPMWPGSWDAAITQAALMLEPQARAGRAGAGRRATGHAYRRAREAVLTLSDICHLCGHPGARQVDHLIPRSRGGSISDPSNLAPAHGGGRPDIDNPCPVCGLRCNQTRGNAMVRRNRVRSRDW